MLTERQAARRARVIAAAVKLAADGGYDAVQMRDVAAEADVALGTLYRYFASKDQLLVAVLGEQMRDLRARLEQQPPQGATPADRVMDMLRRVTRGLERQPSVTAAVVTALSSLSREDPAGLEVARDSYGDFFEILSIAMHDGEPSHPDAEAIVRVLGQVWFATLIEWVRGWIDTKGVLADLDAATRLLLPSNDKRRAPARAR